MAKVVPKRITQADARRAVADLVSARARVAYLEPYFYQRMPGEPPPEERIRRAEAATAAKDAERLHLAKQVHDLNVRLGFDGDAKTTIARQTSRINELLTQTSEYRQKITELCDANDKQHDEIARLTEQVKDLTSELDEADESSGEDDAAPSLCDAIRGVFVEGLAAARRSLENR